MSRSLNIAFFVSADGRSGTYFRYHNLAIALARRGHEVTVHSQSIDNRRGTSEEKREGVHYVLAPSVPLNRFFPFAMNPGNILRRFFTGFQRRALLARHEVFHLFQPFENSAYQWLWERRSRARSARQDVLFAWDWDDFWCGGLPQQKGRGRFQDHMHYWLMEQMEHRLPRLADVVTTCSVFLADLARARGARRVEVIHNGYWPDPATPVCASKAVSRRDFSMDPNAFYLGFTGFTAAEFDWCLDVIAAFADDPGVRLACCGAELRRQIDARSPAIAAKVDHLGYMPAPDVRRLLGALDVGLLPLEDHSFNQSRQPIKFAEYLGVGLPILCSDTGEVGRLGRKLDGVVLLPAERQGWVEGCCRTIRDLRAHRTLPHPNPSQLEDQLSWSAAAARLEALYFEHLP